MRRILFILLMVIALALTACSQKENSIDETIPIDDDLQKISVVNDVFSEYLELFKEDDEEHIDNNLGRILDYTIDKIDIVDSEFEQRLRSSETFSGATNAAIFASVSYTVTPDPNDEKSENWMIPGGDIDGSDIHCFSVLFIDKVNGEYQVIDIGSGW